MIGWGYPVRSIQLIGIVIINEQGIMLEWINILKFSNLLLLHWLLHELIPILIYQLDNNESYWYLLLNRK